MQLKIIGEYGYEQALYGLGLSYGLTSDVTFKKFQNNIELKSKLSKIAYKLSKKYGGYNKFLESIFIYLYVKAPRWWWSEADTYRISTKQSESTIHTLTKHPINKNMFDEPKPPEDYLNFLEKIRCGDEIVDKLEMLKPYLPESFLQARIWILSYKTLRNILSQRRKHKLEQWRYFCDYITNNAENKEYFDDLKY